MGTQHAAHWLDLAECHATRGPGAPRPLDVDVRAPDRSGPRSRPEPQARQSVTMELSGLIPCHNVADTLADQVRALLRQEWHGEGEIVVIDNASTDPPREIAEGVGASCGRIRVQPAQGGR